MEFAEAHFIKDIADPEQADYLKALEQNLAKDQCEEKQIRDCLWREMNNKVRHGRGRFTNEEHNIWKTNCAALLSLYEKLLAEIEKGKRTKEYNKRDRGD